ncbi:hypothetical protein QNI16_21060 [Cytophagaceae bacterium YF14B1]|uniref:Uncharacterized protein n=1 Tax=Xanthocytophaga flava TaxID=3048013 RepID=A0AAE3QT60_9BACT|nr:hypothetical protein [Xanthocytophaga flavus]MDJ1483005.1 hypothetical protein [Xanthocytophaga flavus]
MDDNFEVTEEIVAYLLANYTNLMTLSENAAWRNFSLDPRLKAYQPTGSLYTDRIEALRINVPQVTALMKDGYDTFIQNWIKRIVTEELDKIHFNCCIQCGRLARTPLAQQCRFCGYDWH